MNFRNFSTISPGDTTPTTTREEEDATKCHLDCIDEFTSVPYHTHFVEDKIQREYEIFRMKLVTLSSKLLWLFLGTAIVLDCFTHLINIHDQKDTPVFNVLYFVLVGRILLGFITLFVSVTMLRQSTCIHWSRITFLINVMMIGFPVVNGLLLCWESSLETTDDHLRITSAFYLIVLNLIMIITLRSFSYWALYMSCGLTVVASLGATILSVRHSEYIMVVVSAVATTVVAYAVERDTYTMFKALLNFEESKRLRSSEMKYFIGNVAHDMKVSCIISIL